MGRCTYLESIFNRFVAKNIYLRRCCVLFEQGVVDGQWEPRVVCVGY